MKYIITIAWCFFFVSLHAQFDVEKQQSYGLRFAVGVSNMHDQKSMGKVIPNNICKEVSIFSMQVRERWGALWE